MQPYDADKSAAVQRGSIGIATPFRGVQRYSALAFLFFLLAAAAVAGIWLFLPLPPMTSSVVFQISAQPGA